MKAGEVVEVETFDNQRVKCRLVRLENRTAIVCAEEEWQAAKGEDREPEA